MSFVPPGYKERVSRKSVMYCHTEEIDGDEPQFSPRYEELMDGMLKCKHCGYIPNPGDCAFLVEDIPDTVELGAHIALNHPNKLKKTHPKLFT